MDFYGKTNKSYVMINVFVFRLKNGKEVTLDRDYTGYSIDKDNLSMTWKGCYYWDGESRNYISGEDIKDLRKAELIRIELEDDADPDYTVEINSWY